MTQSSTDLTKEMQRCVNSLTFNRAGHLTSQWHYWKKIQCWPDFLFFLMVWTSLFWCLIMMSKPFYFWLLNHTFYLFLIHEQHTKCLLKWLDMFILIQLYSSVFTRQNHTLLNIEFPLFMSRSSDCTPTIPTVVE